MKAHSVELAPEVQPGSIALLNDSCIICRVDMRGIVDGKELSFVKTFCQSY
jgi:hypothetical protein